MIRMKTTRARKTKPMSMIKAMSLSLALKKYPIASQELRALTITMSV